MKEKSKIKVIAKGPDFDIVFEEMPFSTELHKNEILKIRHRGTAIVVATSGEHLIIVSQFRPIPCIRTLEFPGGVINEGESAEVAVRREFNEETTLILNHVHHMGSFFASIGTSDEIIHYFIGSCSIPKELHSIDDFDRSDQSSDIRIFGINANVIEDLIVNGKLNDGKTALAYLLWKNSKG